jgi:hypothetical protein
MTRDQELRKESAFCRKSAEGAADPSYRLALMELADWWEWQANLARRPMADGLFRAAVASPGTRERASRPSGERIK